MNQTQYDLVLEATKGRLIGRTSFGVDFNGSSWEPREYYSTNAIRTMCPMGALILKEGANLEESNHIQAARTILQTSDVNIWSFINGFDGNEPIPTDEMSWYNAGTRMASEIL